LFRKFFHAHYPFVGARRSGRGGKTAHCIFFGCRS
jgi:hypothetical protein